MKIQFAAGRLFRLPGSCQAMLSKLRIGPKLLLAPCVVLLLLIVLSAGAYYAMVRQNRSLDIIVDQRAAHLRDTATLVQSAQHAHTEIYQLLTWIGAGFSHARIDALSRDINQRHAVIGRRFAALAAVTENGGTERRLVEQANAAHLAYLKAVRDVMELARPDQSTSTNAMSKAERAFDVVALRLGELSRLEQQLSEEASDSAEADFRMMATLMPLVVALSIALSLAITMAVRRSLLREITDIGDAAIDLASGNLLVRQRDYGNDEISDTSRMLDTSIRNLNATLKGIFEAARSIDSASRQMARGSADLSSRTEAQASSLQHTASSMEELNAVVSQNARSALVANELAASASNVATRGSDVVERLVGTMRSIKGSSGKMATIACRIDRIANETGMLALNAAVEAGRAGDHGRGFAQVASEVRTLAQETATAAREIRELVALCVAEIDGGSASVQEAGHSMADIATSVQQVGSIINAISHASAEQATGILEVSQAIVQMDQMTQQNSALVTEAAAAAESLQRQAVSLARAVAGFSLDETALTPLPPAMRAGALGRRPHLRLASKRA